MGEERIRIESYDMPEGKYLHPQDIRLLLSILFDFPMHPPSASNMRGRRGFPGWWKGSSHFLYSNINGCIDMKMKAIDFILNQNAEKLEDLAKKLK
jgi:hypothetical protein